MKAFWRDKDGKVRWAEGLILLMCFALMPLPFWLWALATWFHWGPYVHG